MEEKNILQTLSSVLFSKEISQHFELDEVQEKKEYIMLLLNEYSELLPPGLKQAKEVVLDGFCNPIELQTFPLKGKPVYLKLFRRKWKEAGKDQSYWNTYDLNPEGVKATKEFAAFLKAAYGLTPEQYNSNRASAVRER